MRKFYFASSLAFVSCSFAFGYYLSFRVNTKSSTDLITKLKTISRKDVLIDTDLFPSSNFLDMRNINSDNFREFFDAYLEMYNLLIVNRGEKLHVVDLERFELMWIRDLKTALAESKSQNKPLLIKLTIAGCRPCKLQDMMFYREEKIFSELQNYVLLKIDGEIFTDEHLKSVGAEFNEFLIKSGVEKQGTSYPAIILLNKEKKELLKGFESDWSFYWGKLLTFRKL